MASTRRVRNSNSISEDKLHFSEINESPVDDISLEFFYKPHTLTLLTVSVLGLVYTAFVRDDAASKESNYLSGLCCLTFFFLIISVLAFPNGPFTRPHPALWRIVFGLSVLYFLLLVFILFQHKSDVFAMLHWLFPELVHGPKEFEGHAGQCALTFENVWPCLDIFIVAHFFGWALKAILIRHYGICWTISITWEVTELAFMHLLPNFAECWWDQLILDVLIFNGLGIWFGMYICHKMELRNLHWESIKDIHSTPGKIKRAVLQFTPASWTHMRWLDPNSSYMRIIAVCKLIIVFQLCELNFFFLKAIFYLPTGHIILFCRILLIGAVSAPSIRQYYSYVTDTQCNRVGTQCWLFCAITFTEAIICCKFGQELFLQTEIMNLVAWIVFQLFLSFVFVYGCAHLASISHSEKDNSFFGWFKKWARPSYLQQQQHGDESNASPAKTKSPAKSATKTTDKNHVGDASRDAARQTTVSAKNLRPRKQVKLAAAEQNGVR
ncbi:phosphatidylserine synthase 1-like isoform X2 [Tubulanus polymorphus]|uniref:phosphatidylserine synthase 1-like isoform X2 n=1 Tax=Tubulanus polymorphus TaxID=672921 RepID=UPI003DA480C9